MKYFLLLLLITFEFLIIYVQTETTPNVGIPNLENRSEKKNLIKLTQKNFVVIRGGIDGTNSAKIINQLLSKQRGAGEENSELYVYISTNGGSVIDGMQIIQTLKSLSENKINVKCIADIALSMGFVIFQYCPVRYVTLSTILMQHQMYLESHGPINQVNNYLSFINSMETEIDSQQATRLGKTVAEFKALIAHDWWLFGENNIKHKTADMLTNVLCDFDPTLMNVNETLQTWFGDIVLTYSSCPMARAPLHIAFKNASISSEDKQKIIDMYHCSPQSYISCSRSSQTHEQENLCCARKIY